MGCRALSMQLAGSFVEYGTAYSQRCASRCDETVVAGKLLELCLTLCLWSGLILWCDLSKEKVQGI
jgi:hypothetical protein